MEAGEDGVHPFLPEPRHGTQLTLVLDLDETLMHCQKKGIPDVRGGREVPGTASGGAGSCGDVCDLDVRPTVCLALSVFASFGLQLNTGHILIYEEPGRPYF